MKPFYKVLVTLIGPVFKLLFRIKAVGHENIPADRGFILAANHTSLTDPIFLAIKCKRQIFFMAKAELFKFSPFGWLIKKLGVFPVDRGKGDTGAITTAQNLVKEGKVLGIFPEGTRYLTGAPRKAKSGVAYIAMDTKSDILPVSIYREGKIRLFSKTVIRFGEPIPFDSMVQEEATQRANIRNITTIVTEKITELWEMKF